MFSNQPGDPDYSPLRRVTLVKWVDESKASELNRLRRSWLLEQPAPSRIEQPESSSTCLS